MITDETQGVRISSPYVLLEESSRLPLLEPTTSKAVSPYQSRHFSVEKKTKNIQGPKDLLTVGPEKKPLKKPNVGFVHPSLPGNLPKSIIIEWPMDVPTKFVKRNAVEKMEVLKKFEKVMAPGNRNFVIIIDFSYIFR